MLTSSSYHETRVQSNEFSESSSQSLNVPITHKNDSDTSIQNSELSMTSTLSN